ncbi:MAG TPA: macro domain-containing protein [Candidatus Limnocylindrales bacterium]|nr:macro domain-containing protein [Candidatus Limnocylindrales bacterium]
MTDVQLWHGDICDLEVDAIVNPASTSLWMATGVAAAIKRRAGDEIEFDAVRQGPVPLGSAVVTHAGTLAVRYVIHAVTLGPDRRTSAEAIEAATRAALEQARRLGCESVAIPALGTGVGGFPLRDAADIVVRTVHDELVQPGTLRQIVFALRGSEAYSAFEAALARFTVAPAAPGLEVAAHLPAGSGPA